MEENEKIEEKGTNVLKEIIEWCFCIFLALGIALLTRYYIIAPTVVKQSSMYPTLKENERLMINRIKRISNGEYKSGDIVTFEAPDTPTELADIDLSNPIASYSYEPSGIMGKLVYYVLELNKKSYIKRVIGVEGDRVQIKDGKVYVNGTELKEDYLQNDVTTKAVIYNDIIVPQGCIYVMGDNRDESMDSRTFGCIPLERVEGKVVLRYWPINVLGGVK